MSIIGIPGQCQAIEALGELRGVPDIPLLKAVRRLRQDANQPADERARIIHDSWFIEEPSGAPGAFRAMPKTDRRFGVQNVTEPEFEALLAKITALQKRAIDLKNAISAALHASLDKPA